LIRHLARALANENNYIFGPDMGTNETCMGWIHDEIGRSVGLPREIGGIPLDEVGATGWGVSHAIEVAAEHCDLKLSGARLAIQGFGAVGQHTARFLAAKGVQLVGVADSKGTVAHPDGLDLDKLIELKRNGQSVIDFTGATHNDPEAIIDVPCDIWVPAARPDVINERTVERLKARMVVEGANIAVTPGAEKILHNHNVLCVPDFIANAGGVICAAMEYQGATQAEAFSAIQEKIRHNTRQMLEAAMRQQQPPRESATFMALERLKRAMALRRCSLF
jgi:glutamate dehydrogenase (NAD(P)+)